MDFSKLQKATIQSNKVGYGPMPEADEEVEQRLTISGSGRVWFNSYTYSEAQLRRKQVWLGELQARRLLDLIGAYFGSCEEITLATDVGMWEMKLWDTQGETTKFVGSLCCHFLVEGKNLSAMIREALGMGDLLLFDEGISGDESENEV